MGPEEIEQVSERRAFLLEDDQVEDYLCFVGPNSSSKLFSSLQGLGTPLTCALVFLEYWLQDKVSSLRPYFLYTSVYNASLSGSGHLTSWQQLKIC